MKRRKEVSVRLDSKLAATALSQLGQFFNATGHLQGEATIISIAVCEMRSRILAEMRRARTVKSILVSEGTLTKWNDPYQALSHRELDKADRFNPKPKKKSKPEQAENGENQRIE